MLLGFTKGCEGVGIWYWEGCELVIYRWWGILITFHDGQTMVGLANQLSTRMGL